MKMKLRETLYVHRKNDNEIKRDTVCSSKDIEKLTESKQSSYSPSNYPEEYYNGEDYLTFY